jgi:predicted MPP superfamily phosphohydrolase
VFGFILISVITLMHIYVFWRAGSVDAVKRHIPRKLLIGSGLFLWATFFLGRVYGHHGTSSLAKTLELIGMNWMGMLFLLFVSLFAMDFLSGFGFLLVRFAPFLRGIGLLAGVVLSAAALVQGLRPPVVLNYEVDLSGLADKMDGTVLVAMSDLHLGSVLNEGWLEARVAQVKTEQPDLVVLLGDLFEGHGEPQGKLLPILRRLSAPLGVWVVPGNHEFYRRHTRSTVLIEEAGFHLLRNRWAEVRPGLVLAGVDDLTASRRYGERGDQLSKALSGRPPGATILLSHTPWEADKAAAAGVGLMLSGHTHGGQIWPFGYLVKRVYPLLGGRYEVDGMTVIVCRGTGTWGPRMRFWRPSEILRLKLHTGRKGDISK